MTPQAGVATGKTILRPVGCQSDAAPSGPRAHRVSRSYAAVAGIFAIVIGAAVLVGWQFRISFLKNPLEFARSSSMTPNAALCFIVCGVSLWIQGRQQQHRMAWWFAKACAALVSTFGALTIVEYVSRTDFGIDRLFFRHRLTDWTLPPPVGRFAFISAVAFALLGIALLLFERRRRGWEFLPLTTAFIAFVSILGYLYGARFLYAFGSPNNVALHTAVTFLVLAVGTLLARTEAGISAIVVSHDVDGQLTRRFLVAIVLLLPIIGWIRLEAERWNLVEHAMGTALLVCLSVVVFSALTISSARLLRSENEKRQVAQQAIETEQRRLAGIIDSAMDAIISVGEDQRILLFNRAAEAIFRCSAESAIGHALDDFIPPRFRSSHREHVARFGETGVTSRSMYRPGTLYGLRADGEEFPLEASISQLGMEGRKVFTVILRDVAERKRADAEIRKSKDLLETFVRDAPASLAMFDRQMRYVRVSRQWLEDTGLSNEENVLGRSHYEVSPGLPAHWKEMHCRGLAGEQLKSEEDWVARDGQRHTIRWEIHPWGDSGVETGGIIIYFEDITDRKRAEALLIAQKETFELAVTGAPLDSVLNLLVQSAQKQFDGAQTAIFIIDAEGACLRFGAAAGMSESYTRAVDRFQVDPTSSSCGTAAYTGQAVIVRDVAHDPLWAPYLSLAQEHGIRACWSFPIRSLEGKVLGTFALYHGSPRGPQPRDLECVALFANTAAMIIERYKAAEERKRIEETLRRAARFDEAVMSNMGEGLYTVDAEGRVTFMNPAAEKLFGWTLDELRGMKMHDATHCKHRDGSPFPAAECAGFQVLQNAKTLTNHEDVFIRRDGTFFDVVYSSSPIREGDQITGLVVVFRDITERKQAEAALRNSERLAAVGKLAATIAHEINNPLESITNLLYLVRRDKTMSDSAKEFLSLADEEINRVVHLAKQTLGFYRDPSLPTSIPVAAAIQNVVKMYKRKLQSRDINLAVDIDQKLRVHGLGGEFRQVFSNLIVNAADAMADTGGRLIVRAHGAHDLRNGYRPGARISVADSGGGIPADQFRRIFDAFFTTKKGAGTGLGLWISREIVERHGGWIKARTRYGQENNGTVFMVFWPQLQ